MTARLAVVDDDEAFGGYLQTLFQTRGYEVDVYGSGAALLDGLRGGPQPNVVLLDVMMPDVDGIETLRQIRQAHPSAQVIMLSGRQAPATIVEAVRLGAADYVLKPSRRRRRRRGGARGRHPQRDRARVAQRRARAHRRPARRGSRRRPAVLELRGGRCSR